MSSPPDSTVGGRRLREVVPLAAEAPKLIILVLATVAAFLLTRTIAGYERSRQAREAAEWAALGRRALDENRVEQAIDAFRRAAARNRSDTRYATSLAAALIRDNQLQAAMQVLLVLRQRSPEDPEVNLQLARVTARMNDVSGALRYYRSALYAPWSNPQSPLDIRLELSAFLLAHNRRTEAISELLAAAAAAPEQPDVALRLGGLLLDAGDFDRASRVYGRVLAAEPMNQRALLGAGTTAYRRGQFATAVRYLRQVSDDAGAAEMRTVAEEVLARDPLAPRIRLAERRRRVAADLDYIGSRLQTCLAGAAAGSTPPALDAPIAAVDAASKRTRTADSDAIEDALDAIAGAETALAAACGAPMPTDRALAIIAGMRQERS